MKKYLKPLFINFTRYFLCFYLSCVITLFLYLSKYDAMYLYIDSVKRLEKELSDLVDEWKDELDPRVPDKNAWVPEEDAEKVRKITEDAKRERRYVTDFSQQVLFSQIYA